MANIREGEYVRLYDGTIYKVDDLEEYQFLWDDFYNHIVNHSFNLKDLIKAKDFVNGFQVDEFDDNEGNLFLGIPIYDDSLMNCIVEALPIDKVEIKEILAYEQYERRRYKV